MSEALLLLGVLGAFYLQDCSLWIPRETVVFLTRRLAGWRPIQPHPLFSRRGKGILVSFRLPPLAPVFICRPGPGAPLPVEGGLAARLDAEACERDLARLRSRGWLLQLLCNGLFGYLFLLLPGLLVVVSLERFWPLLLAAVIGLVVPVCWQYVVLHRALWPEEVGERRSELLHCLLYPPAALRAYDRLAHRLCAGYHPLAVAAGLCAPPVFAAFAAGWLRRLDQPLATEATAPESRQAERDALHTLLRRLGHDPARLLAPPARTDEQSRSYCPRCETAYTLGEGHCGDCPGVALIPYAAPQESRAASVTPGEHT